MRMLIIGDPHAHPRHDNVRFEHLGRVASNLQVDHVHCVGDWTDFPSLNEHKSAKEQRPDLYADDLEAGNDALMRFDEGMIDWECTKTITLGNHDVYPSRWVSSNPKFEGIISPTDIEFVAHGWKVHDFELAADIKGILGSHYFPSSASSSRAQGGLHVAYQNVTKQKMSCVVGHNHRFDHKISTDGLGNKLHSFSAGCMNHPRYNEKWCRSTNKHWDRGVLIVELNRRRVEEFRFIDYNKVKREYI